MAYPMQINRAVLDALAAFRDGEPGQAGAMLEDIEARDGGQWKAYAAASREAAQAEAATATAVDVLRRAACPPVGNPDLPEPLEFLAR